MKALKSLRPYFYRYRYRLLAGLVITAVARLFTLYVPELVKEATNHIETFLLTDGISTKIIQRQLLFSILKIIGASLLAAGFTFMMRQTIIVVSRWIEYDMKNAIYLQYQRLTQAFFKRNRTGDLMNRISEDVSKVRLYAGPAIMYGVNALTLIIFIVPLMFYISPSLSMYVLLPLPFLSFAIYKLSQSIHRQTHIVQQFLSKLNTEAQEAFSGIGVITAYNLQPQFVQEFYALSEEGKDKNMDLARLQAMFFPLMLLLIGASNVLVIYIGGKQYMDGSIADFGTLVQFLLYVNLLTWPVTSVGWITNIVKQAEASQQRINEFLHIEPEIFDPNPKANLNINGAIRFDSVSFTYPDTGITAIKDLSFELKDGQTLAIIGATGSGKTTVLDLICRVYDPDQGKIFIDDKNLKNLPLSQLRSQIGYVPQDAFLFSESIRDNIAFGVDYAEEQAVINAAKIAHVHHNIINFKSGYDTILGERGISLSGGQKQRISIARALIKKPKLLLFDDCLSAVDTETEEKILNGIKAYSKQITTIIVSHRISAAQHADQVIVLKDGRIAETGTHEQLILQKGYYYELYQIQLKDKK
ncbi:MAG: ABC transporter ATP-binding protein [Flavobacteriaceae bacterium]|nr:ABC transporter ATP-binding protein [Flavobacteriaceae bacterium]